MRCRPALDRERAKHVVNIVEVLEEGSTRLL